LADSLEQLKTDAAETLAAGQNCDVLVLRAIGLGCDTRARIKEVTGFDYAAIEKALEREAGAIQLDSSGPVDRLSLAGARSNGNGAGKADIPFNPPTPRKPAKKKESVSLVGYVEEAPEPDRGGGLPDPTAPTVTMKIAHLNSETGAQSMTRPNVVLDEQSAHSPPVNIRIGIQGNKAWLETEDGAVIGNIEIEDIQFSTCLPIHVKFKFKD
jgi:hypothetical protein